MTPSEKEDMLEQWAQELMVAVRQGDMDRAEELAQKISQTAYYDRV